jgi:hypothetical protein
MGVKFNDHLENRAEIANLYLWSLLVVVKDVHQNVEVKSSLDEIQNVLSSCGILEGHDFELGEVLHEEAVWSRKDEPHALRSA